MEVSFMKKAKRILALLLAVVLIATGSSVTTFAMKYDYKTPLAVVKNGHTTDMYYFSAEQGGTYVMDLIDDLLPTLNDGMDMRINYSILIDKTIAFGQGYDGFLSSVYDLWNANIIGIAKTLNLAGDLERLVVNASTCRDYTRRGHATIADINCIYNLLLFLKENDIVLANLVNDSFDFGLLGSEGTIALDVIPAELENIGPFLTQTVWELLAGLAGKTDEEIAAAAAAQSWDIDALLQDMINFLIGDLLPGVAISIDLKTASLYDVVNSLIDALLGDMLAPMLTEVIAEACDIVATPEYPMGNPDDINNETLVMICGIVEDLVGAYVEPPVYEGDAAIYPIAKINKLLTWFLAEGGMSAFIVIDDNGIAITDNFMSLLTDISRLAIPLVYNLGMDDLPQSEIYTQDQLNIPEGQPGYISQDAVWGQLIKIVLSSITDGYYCPPEADTIVEVGSYALASLCARILPERNFFDQLDANYAEGTYYDYNGEVVEPLPFETQYSTKCKVDGAQVTRTYTVPLAAIQMGYEIGIFFLDGMVDCDFTQVTATGMQGFEQFLKTLVDWVLTRYAPIIGDSFNITTNYPNASDVWLMIDEVIFSLIPASWLPATVESTFGGAVSQPVKCALDLICNWLLDSVLNLNLQKLLSLLRVNPTGELNDPFLQVLLRIIDRVFYIVFGNNGCLLPSDQATRNPFNTNTTVTSIGGLLSFGGGSYKGNVTELATLGQVVYYLLNNLYNNRVSICETLFPLLLSTNYVPKYRDTVSNPASGTLAPGQISVAMLQKYIDGSGTKNTVEAPYIEAENVNALTQGTYYTVEVTMTGIQPTATATQVTLPDDFVQGTTYYTTGWEVDGTADAFAQGTYYLRTDTYELVTLDGTNFDGNQTYYSADYAEAAVDETTNGTFYTAQNESSAVTLPEGYVEGTVYYYHPVVSLGAASTGTYYICNSTYTPQTFIGTAGNNYIKNKTYYKVATTRLEYDYLNSYNPETGKLAMNVYSAGDAASRGIGSYASSIPGQQGYLYLDTEDFPSTLFTYNNWKNFMEDAQGIIDEYKNFVEYEIPEATAAWKEYFADETGNVGIPGGIYPYYNATGAYGVQVANLNLPDGAAGFNNLQAITDAKNLFGIETAFITNGIKNTKESGQHNRTVPYDVLPSSSDAGNTELDVEIASGWKEYVTRVEELSNGLNDYWDGMNYYMAIFESARKPYTDTCTDPLEFFIDKYEGFYNNGNNTTVDENGDTIKRYTDKTWARFKSAYECAEDLVAQVLQSQASARTTQSMVTIVREELMNAYYELVEFGEMADLYALLQYITSARRIIAQENGLPEDEKLFTVDSMETLSKMLDLATNVYDSTPGIDEQETLVDPTAGSLKNALDSLIYRLAPDLVVNEDIVDNVIEIGETWVNNGVLNGYIYGLTEGAGLKWEAGSANNPVSVVGVSEDGVKCHALTYGPGTGSYIVAVDSANSTVFRFTAVIFGDVNGDARIDGVDKITVAAISNGVAGSDITEAEMLAADVDNNGTVDNSDAAALELVYGSYEATINQAETVEGSRVIMN